MTLSLNPKKSTNSRHAPQQATGLKGRHRPTYAHVGLCGSLCIEQITDMGSELTFSRGSDLSTTHRGFFGASAELLLRSRPLLLLLLLLFK